MVPEPDRRRDGHGALPAADCPETFAEAPRRNFIDELVLEKLASLNLPPSPPAGDAEFIRRAFLDTIGVLPTAGRDAAFLADNRPTSATS